MTDRDKATGRGPLYPPLTVPEQESTESVNGSENGGSGEELRKLPKQQQSTRQAEEVAPVAAASAAASASSRPSRAEGIFDAIEDTFGVFTALAGVFLCLALLLLCLAWLVGTARPHYTLTDSLGLALGITAIIIGVTHDNESCINDYECMVYIPVGN